jgi:hypothetical protein
MSLKKVKYTFLKILIAVILFAIITLLTHQNQLAVDGILTYGFPFSFYEQCGDCVPGFEEGFKLEYFILDLSIFTFFIFLMFHFFNKKK